ncbi:DUF3500 domain-containing protein [Bacillus sp. B1-b2]|uniref:DUF3500 domain-containing protein n=1 Tax=Bacillus sp. B1-b2 TaxID=2653201 RepID=UPI001869D782|nr:DUF3500 domain-containing protein [Bacillus sp. B1-b2]
MRYYLPTFYSFIILVCVMIVPGSIVHAEANTSSEVAEIVKQYPHNLQKENSVELANQFLTTLTTEQKDKALVPVSKATLQKWSNLPVNEFKRQGVMLQELSKESLEAALRLAESALSKDGFKTMKEIILADDYQFTVSGNTKWGSQQYYIAILGNPTMSTHWMLQITGHHLTENSSFHKGKLESVTPQFTGIEPDTFTRTGITYSPLKTRRDSMYKMIHSLHKKQLADAEIKSGPDDVVVIPQNSHSYPKQEGIPFYALTIEQQGLVESAIKAWINDANSEAYLPAYLDKQALKKTYIGWSGSTQTGKKPNYIRIDGPRLWIEFASKEGAMSTDNLHYHTVWRDKQTDYGTLLQPNSR